MSADEIPLCVPVSLDPSLTVEAAAAAVEINPRNHPNVAAIQHAIPEFTPTPEHLAVMTSKYWGTQGVRLTVAFLEQTPEDLKQRILSHLNAWGNEYTNVRFVLSNVDPQVRITREGSGYWSYLGTDILSIPRGQPTMCLQRFTMQTRESEFVRVVRHECGHTLGFPHEHLRRDLVNLLDPNRTIQYFGQTQGWSAGMVRQQVLTPLDEATLRDPTPADQTSIMCYQIPGACTKSGQPILGGADINAQDRQYAAKLYPTKVIKWEDVA